MNTDFWHRQWIRAMQALLILLCAGFFTFSMAAGHSPCHSPNAPPSASHSPTSVYKQPGTLLAALVIEPESTISVIPSNHHQHVDHQQSQKNVSAMIEKIHREHVGHGDSQSTSSGPCPMPGDGTHPCPLVCALACAAGGVSASTITNNVPLPLDWAFTRVPRHDDVDAIVEVTLPPLYRPPIS